MGEGNDYCHCIFIAFSLGMGKGVHGAFSLVCLSVFISTCHIMGGRVYGAFSFHCDEKRPMFELQWKWLSFTTSYLIVMQAGLSKTLMWEALLVER